MKYCSRDDNGVYFVSSRKETVAPCVAGEGRAWKKYDRYLISATRGSGLRTDLF